MTPLTDDDGDISDVQWQWYRSSSSSLTGGTAIGILDGDDNPTGSQTQTYTVQDTPATPNDVGQYLRVEATYRDSQGPNQTASFVSRNRVQRTRQSANTAPEFPSTSVARRITEDTTDDVGAPVRATDADGGDILTYSLLEADTDNDNGTFSIDRATGQLMVGDGGLDFEMPTDVAGVGVTLADGVTADAENNNVYVVTLRATDSSGDDSETVTVAITVTDVNEAPEFDNDITFPADLPQAEQDLPRNTDEMAADHPENTESLDIAIYTATDPEDGGVTLSLTGDDAAQFELGDDAEDDADAVQVLSFKEEPDFEMPEDRNGDNIYKVTVRASDGRFTTDQTVSVKVTDADETGEVELSSQDALIGVELTAELTDSDSGAPDPARLTNLNWTWQSGTPGAGQDCADVATWTAAGTESSNAYIPGVDDLGDCLRAVVTYTDRTRDENNNPADNTATATPPFVGFMNTATSDPTTAVRNTPGQPAAGV